VSACYGNNAAWPPNGDNAPGMDVKISGQYTFVSALGMFWPGAGNGVNFASFYFPAFSRGQIQF
jgi:hypothetical protein